MWKFIFTEMGIKGKKDKLYLINGVANIEADLTLSHLRILMAIIKSLQTSIRYFVVKEKGIPKERSLPPGGVYEGAKVRRLRIPVTDFNMPQNNSRLRSCLEEMKSVGCIFSNGSRFDGFIAGFSYAQYSRYVDVYIPEELTKLLLNPSDGFFYFFDHEAQSMTNKYILRIYWLVCSWRGRGGFVISVENFRRIMGITERYSRIDNLEQKILIPAREYMKSHFTLWFQYRRYDQAGGPLLAFKLKVELSEEQRQEILSNTGFYCRNLLSSYGLKVEQIEKFMAMIEPEDYPLLVSKMAQIRDYIGRHPDIRDKAAYFLSSLLTWQDNWLEMFRDPSDEDSL